MWIESKETCNASIDDVIYYLKIQERLEKSQEELLEMQVSFLFFYMDHIQICCHHVLILDLKTSVMLF